MRLRWPRRRAAGVAPADESWFGALGVDAAEAAESRQEPWPQDEGPPGGDSRFLARQARRMAAAGGSAFERLYRAFLVARAFLGWVLVGGLALGALLGMRVQPALAAVALLYVAQAQALLLPRPGRAQRLSLRAGLATIGVDLLAFFGLHLLHDGAAFNFGALLVLPLLMAGVLTPRRTALALAAALTLALLGGAAHAVLGQGADAATAFGQAGLAGLGSFVLVLLVGELAARLAREEQAARGSLELARQQAQLNRLVIEEMGEGVLVVDARLRVRVLNPAARALLAAREPAPPAPVWLAALPGCMALAQALAQAFEQAGHWPEGGRDVALDFGAQGLRTLRVRARFTRPRGGAHEAAEPLCVLFVEDLRQVLARQRQDRLAAMGRVSAGIAHEIRNPLSAIAQANALLLEDLQAPAARRLAQIVADNAQRLKRLVDEVMELAPGRAAASRVLDATAEAATVAVEWARTGGVSVGAQGRLQLLLPPAPLPVLFEPEHLRRVLVNLLDNAARHAGAQPGAIVLRLQPGPPGRALLAVASDGEPIAAQVEPLLFEPFFSTRSRGAGLGLYICKELCERHGAAIDYRLHPAGARHRNEFLVMLRTADVPSPPVP